MIPKTPQELADLLGLYMVRKNGLWYGCVERPVFNTTWDMESARIEVIIRSRSVLYIGEDKDSLFEPRW